MLHRVLFLALILLFVGCQQTPTPTLTVSPGNQTIAAGSAPIGFTATLTNSTATINWSLDPASGAGTLSSLTGPSTTYTPPASIASTTAVTLTATAGALSRQVILIVNPATDSTAPTVVSVTPANLATGVAANANIVVTFSERMNQSATQTAYQSATVGIRPVDVTFSWNAEGTVLTINPNANLALATGTSNAVVALNYVFSITNTATDVAGNALTTLNSSFKTLRDLTFTFDATALSGDVRSDGAVNTADCLVDICVGDSGSVGNATYRGFLTFDLSGLPATLASANIVSATLRVYRSVASNGDPYGDLLDCSGSPIIICSNLLFQHVNYGPTLTDTDFDTNTLASLAITGCLFTTGCADVAGYREAGATDVVRDDWTNKASRGNRSQFRIRFARNTDGDGNADIAYFSRGAAATNPNELVVRFLIP